MQSINQEPLDSLLSQEKYERTSYESFKDRGNILRGNESRRISKNEMPYVEYNNKKVIDHLTMWSGGYGLWRLIEDGCLSLDNYHEEGYTIVINPHKEQSVPSRPHIHLLLLE